MFTIITPKQFKTIPWKNGKGQTQELCINDGGTIDLFDWRISIASVTQDGTFSNFPNYQRKLILIKGNGIKLIHDENKTNMLNNVLDMASFNGKSITRTELVDGSIFDFNVMTHEDKYNCKVDTYVDTRRINISKCDICFIYNLDGEVNVKGEEISENFSLPIKHLMKIEQSNLPFLNEKVVVTGNKMIIITLDKKKST